MSIMVVASIVDTSIVRLSAFTGGLAPNWNLIAFSILVLIYSVGQYVILNFIKEKIEISKIKPANTIHKIVSIIQWIIISMLVIIVLQMIFTSSYSLLFLKLIALISCGLSIVILAFLAKKFFVWFRSSRDIVMISYAIAMLILTVNILFMVVYVIDMLNSREDYTRYTQNPVINVTNASNVFNTTYFVSSIFSFIMVWVTTVFLLRYYSKRIGSAKYWILVSAPLFYFLAQFQLIFFDLFESFRLSDPTLFAITFTLLVTMSKPIGGVLFGVAFWVVSRRVGKHAIKDYLLVSGFGIMLLFASNQATTLIFAPYPPFGLVTTSLIGLSSYLLLVGIYSSAMSISRDTELRKFITTVTEREIKLLGNIGFAQVEQELVTKIIPLAQLQALKMEQESGVKTSFTDSDLKDYLEKILTEVRNTSQNKESGA